jgi:hypothetical protein
MAKLVILMLNYSVLYHTGSTKTAILSWQKSFKSSIHHCINTSELKCLQKQNNARRHVIFYTMPTRRQLVIWASQQMWEE